MDYKTKKILIWGSSIVGGLAVLLLILLLASGIITGRVTYIVDGEVYTEQTGARVKKYSYPEDPKKEGYLFGGWFEDEDLTEPFELNQMGFMGLFYGKRQVYADFKQHSHSYITRESEKATCTKPGVTVTICKDTTCNHISSTKTIPMKEHTVSRGELVPYVNPDGSLRFSFVGKCSDCNKSFDQRSVTADVDIKVVKKASCQNEGTTIYTYSVNGKKYTYEHTFAQTEHMLNNRPISDYYTYDGYVAYGTKGVYISDAPKSTPKCEEEFIGKFSCQDCKKTIEVKVRQPHKDTITVDIPADCVNPGQNIHTCSAVGCKDPIRKIKVEAFGHLEDGVNSWKLSRQSATSFVINCYCNRVNCGVELFEPYKVDKSLVSSSVLSTSSCETRGKTLHAYDDDDLSISFVEYDDYLPHTLKGVSVDKITYSDGSFPYGTDGLFISAGTQPPKCGERSDMYYYTCDECKQIVLCEVNRKHNYVYSVVSYPSCDKDGQIKYTCSYCNVSYTETAEKLNHVAIFLNGKRSVVYQTNSNGLIYADQAGITLPEGYEPKVGETVKGLYECPACKDIIEADVYVRKK